MWALHLLFPMLTGGSERPLAYHLVDFGAHVPAGLIAGLWVQKVARDDDAHAPLPGSR